MVYFSIEIEKKNIDLLPKMEYSFTFFSLWKVRLGQGRKIHVLMISGGSVYLTIWYTYYKDKNKHTT